MCSLPLITAKAFKKDPKNAKFLPDDVTAAYINKYVKVVRTFVNDKLDASVFQESDGKNKFKKFLLKYLTFLEELAKP